MRTLIVDDHESVVSLLARVCRHEGHDVTPLADSAQALIHLATAPVDLLITDLQMPGPDGLTVIREARRLQPEIFTIVITGHAGQYPVAEVLATGTADIIFKPFHMNELRARLSLAQRRRDLIVDLENRNRALERIERR